MNYEINNLHQKFIKLFNKFNSNNYTHNYEKDGESMISEIGQIDNPIIFNYEFGKEIDYGFIEYKRTLIYYNLKKSKLLRQIYWRISESFNYNLNLCYYIIGLENSGIYSNINSNELQNSLDIIKKTIINTNINCEYVFLFDNNYNSKILVVKLYIENINYLNYIF
jgi:hypothetical protein